MKILVIGYGLIGEKLAETYKDHNILGIRRSDKQKHPNTRIVKADYRDEIPMEAVDFSPDWIIVSPKVENQEIDSYEHGFMNQLELIKEKFKNTNKIFISSTRVLSGIINEQVDESAKPKPSDPQGEIIKRYEEDALLDPTSYVLRLAGLITESSNFVNLVIEKKIFSTDKFINAIHIDDVINIIDDVIQKNPTHRIINAVMPETIKYSDVNDGFKAEPINPAIKSLHYNDVSFFKYPSIRELI